MATNFPTSLQDLDATRGASGQPLSTPNHVTHHTTEDDTIEALQAKVGIDGSAVTTSHDYKLSNVTGSNKAVSQARSISTTAPLTGGGDLSADITLAVSAATTSASGVSELATTAETSTGTDTGRVVTPDGLAGSVFGERIVEILVTDPNGDVVTVGDGKAYFRVPSSMGGMDLVEVAAHVTTASTSGTPTIQIRNETQTADMLSTRITLDANEKDSSTAATAAVIDTSNDDVASGDIIQIDVDVAGTNTKGLLVQMIFRLP